MSINSRQKPWYNCATKKTIEADPEALYFEGFEGYTNFYDIATPIFSKLHYRHTATHNGYISPYDMAILPYHGKFGEGKIIVMHHSEYRVLFKYYIEGKRKNANRKV